MIHERGNSGKQASQDWLEFRAMARETAFSPEEFSEQERTRYNLDSDDRLAPARITGANSPDSYNGADSSLLDDVPVVPLEDDPTR